MTGVQTCALPISAESGRVLAHFHDILRDFPEEPSLKRMSFHQGTKVHGVLDEITDVLTESEEKQSCEGIEGTIGDRKSVV